MTIGDIMFRIRMDHCWIYAVIERAKAYPKQARSKDG